MAINPLKRSLENSSSAPKRQTIRQPLPITSSTSAFRKVYAEFSENKESFQKTVRPLASRNISRKQKQRSGDQEGRALKRQTRSPIFNPEKGHIASVGDIRFLQRSSPSPSAPPLSAWNPLPSLPDLPPTPPPSPPPLTPERRSPEERIENDEFAHRSPSFPESQSPRTPAFDPVRLYNSEDSQELPPDVAGLPPLPETDDIEFAATQPTEDTIDGLLDQFSLALKPEPQGKNADEQDSIDKLPDDLWNLSLAP